MHCYDVTKRTVTHGATQPDRDYLLHIPVFGDSVRFVLCNAAAFAANASLKENEQKSFKIATNKTKGPRRGPFRDRRSS